MMVGVFFIVYGIIPYYIIGKINDETNNTHFVSTFVKTLSTIINNEIIFIVIIHRILHQ